MLFDVISPRRESLMFHEHDSKLESGDLSLPIQLRGTTYRAICGHRPSSTSKISVCSVTELLRLLNTETERELSTRKPSYR